MISEADKLLQVIKREIGYTIIEKNNKYEYDLKYVYNIIDKNTEIDDYNQLFIIWCYIKAFGKVRGLQLLGIPFTNTELITLSRMQKIAENKNLLYKPEGIPKYVLYKIGIGDQLLYLRDQNLVTGIVIAKSNTDATIVELKNNKLVVETNLTEYVLYNDVFAFIKYLDDDVFVANLQNESIYRQTVKGESSIYI